MTERPISRVATTRARQRSLVAALMVTGCGGFAIWMLQLWLTRAPIVDLRL